MDISEALRMADYYESEFGDTFTAAAIRNMVQYANIKGYEVFNINELINANDFEEVLKLTTSQPNDVQASEDFYENRNWLYT